MACQRLWSWLICALCPPAPGTSTAPSPTACWPKCCALTTSAQGSCAKKDPPPDPRSPAVTCSKTSSPSGKTFWITRNLSNQKSPTKTRVVTQLRLLAQPRPVWHSPASCKIKIRVDRSRPKRNLEHSRRGPQHARVCLLRVMGWRCPRLCLPLSPQAQGSFHPLKMRLVTLLRSLAQP